MVAERASKQRRGVCEELVCSTLGVGLSLAGERPPGRASHRSPRVPLSSCSVSPAEPRDSTEYLVMVDAGVGRCLGAGAMQNMQEGG